MRDRERETGRQTEGEIETVRDREREREGQTDPPVDSPSRPDMVRRERDRETDRKT